ncbi:hypothetical protein LCGC14_1175700 [marine sediment metagenome]|uniref:Uncharacterized protein n=1 Tax=marine sediment metagenome TaxID=412755 RepID=A0A0F9MBH4_9ZZZZ
MALEPGDRVTEVCEKVGKFPFALLDNPNSLQLDSIRHLKTIDTPEGIRPIRGSLPLTSLKQEYIDLFKGNNLTICESENFAYLHTPLRCKLSSVSIYLGINPMGPLGGDGIYKVTALGPIRIYQGGNDYTTIWNQVPNTVKIHAMSGETIFDLYNGPEISSYNETTFFGGFFYENTIFKCTAKISYVIEDTGDLYFGYPVYLLHVQLTVVIEDDNGEITVTEEATSLPRTTPALNINLSHSVETGIVGVTGEVGTLTKSAVTGFHVFVGYN